MATVASLIETLGKLAPWGKAAAWDPVGLQLGDARAEVSAAAVCHEVTASIVDRVVADGIDLLVSYHPLLFRPVSTITAGPGPAGRALRFLQHGTALIVVHTAFDVAPGGTADALAEALGLSDTSPCAPLWGPDSAKVVTFVPEAHVDAVTEAMAGAGAGAIGNYTHCSFRSAGDGTFVPGPGATPMSGRVGSLSVEPEVRIEMVVAHHRLDRVVTALVDAHPYDEPAFDVIARGGEPGFIGRIGGFAGSFSDLVDTAGRTLGSVVRAAGGEADGPLRVAVVPGSGGSVIDSVAETGADAMVTGDVKHHDARRALERGLRIVDAGHAATEKPGVARLYAAVAGEVATVDLTGVDPDPWA